MNSTIIYCSSNKERPEFEAKIIKTLLINCGNIPIVSVTQKPIKLGTNICVGSDVGVSGFNFFRQSLIACEAARTEFVISAEADCLYPPDYFKFTPERDDVCYRNSNLYVMGNKRDYYYKKEEGATHAQIVGRQFYINTLKDLFKGAPMWNGQEKNFPKERRKQEDVFKEVIHYKSENPVVQIKTGDSMRHYTHSDRIPVYDIPYWGDGKVISNYYKS